MDKFKGADKREPRVQFEIGYDFYLSGEYKKAKIWFEKSAKQGNIDAQYNLGSFFLIEGNYKEAKKWFENAASQGDIQALDYLGNLCENGLIDGKRDYIRAREFYKKVAEKTDHHYVYDIIKTFEEEDFKERILEIEDISSFFRMSEDGSKANRQLYNMPDDELRDKYKAVKIRPKLNIDVNSHTLYSIEDFISIKRDINALLEDVPKVKDDKSNELEVFMQVYCMLGELVDFDIDAVDQDNDYITMYTSRNLVRSVLENQCLCVRICRSIKKYVGL